MTAAIRISPPSGPRDLSLHSGLVSITVKPCTSVFRRAARSRAAERITALKDGAALLGELGFNEEDFPKLEDPHIMAGLSQLLYAIELGAYLITAWSGYVDENGAAFAVNRETITAVMRTDAEDFLLAEAAASDQVSLAGNGSTASPNGTGKAGAKTAKPAGSKTRPARAAKKA